ncbi:ABC transporter ATP-binding protein [Pigmentiphaga sp. GD03639]|jgi:branched-chain amino acid transport system ATP-binding protein|uniref:ABC transporter ATP-binding protein n=1 Tax=Pigmentiphaga daeguensis TaxID=414049 RepID=A0ABN1BCC2_9BURK|nr:MULTISPECIES: ABC transporter ATP-binding protein [unclassified Pigmentiphaga]MDH2238846.1 ABC transporter ATP-binding protein [Pigmentiphaga sp. GD03639]
MEALIDASQVHAWYGSSHILHGVDFRLGRGETVGLLGRNGMGKSTLIRTLLGHVKQRDGRISIAGRDLSRGKPYEAAKAGIAYVPEGRGIFPNLTVKENLVMAARRGVDGQADWTLERVLATFPRLTERMGNLGWQLSGGEQQMLSIGRALMTNPSAVILDEATEGLAPLIVAEIWRVIGDIRRSGLATLVVDRNYRMVMANSDRLVVMEKGRMVLEGQAQDLAHRPEALSRYLGV